MAVQSPVSGTEAISIRRSPVWSARQNIREFLRRAPYLMVFPGMAILLSALSFNLLGDGLRDALDPRLKS